MTDGRTEGRTDQSECFMLPLRRGGIITAPIAANPVSALSVIFTPFVRNLDCMSVTIDSIENQLFNGENCFLISQIVLKLLTAKGHIPVWLEQCPLKLIFENQKYFAIEGSFKF